MWVVYGVFKSKRFGNASRLAIKQVICPSSLQLVVIQKIDIQMRARHEAVPLPLALGGPVGGRCKQVAATISHYYPAHLLSDVTTIIRTKRATITSSEPTIRLMLNANYQKR